MLEQQKEILETFFETYIKSFLTARLQDRKGHYQRIVISLVYTALEKSKEEFVTFLKGFYPYDDAKANNLSNELFCKWITLYDIFHGKWKHTDAAKLPEFLNDKRFFALSPLTNNEIAIFLQEATKSWLTQYRKEHHITFNPSLPNNYYIAASQGNFSVLSSLPITAENINLQEQLYGNSLLHCSLASLAQNAINKSFDIALNSVKCVKLLLNRGAQPTIVNFSKQTPITLFFDLLPSQETTLLNPLSLQCIVTGLKYCVNSHKEFLEEIINTLKAKGYNDTAEKLLEAIPFPAKKSTNLTSIKGFMHDLK